MAFRFEQKVLFKHCDPARIVFFPRYFEMMNDCVEMYFDQVLDAPFEHLHQDAAVPTAQIETRFSAPSRHGDTLILSLHITAVGRSSMRYRMRAHAGDELRFDTTATLVHVGLNGKAAPWPDDLRARLLAEKDNEHES
ncbi:MAG: thioesterase family protein [Pseudomonadota bacterium]